jgi:hypothetical protein
LKYRAVAEKGIVEAGTWQVFCHHGLGYAIDVWPGLEESAKRTLMLKTIEGYAISRDEPFNGEMPEGWPSFYWRVRFGGTNGAIQERLLFDLERCMR